MVTVLSLAKIVLEITHTYNAYACNNTKLKQYPSWKSRNLFLLSSFCSPRDLFALVTQRASGRNTSVAPMLEIQLMWEKEGTKATWSFVYSCHFSVLFHFRLQSAERAPTEENLRGQSVSQQREKRHDHPPLLPLFHINMSEEKDETFHWESTTCFTVLFFFLFRSLLSSFEMFEVPYLSVLSRLFGSLFHPVLTSGYSSDLSGTGSGLSTVSQQSSSLCHDEMVASLPDVRRRNQLFLHWSWQHGGTSSFGLEQVWHKENLWWE